MSYVIVFFYYIKGYTLNTDDVFLYKSLLIYLGVMWSFKQ